MTATVPTSAAVRLTADDPAAPSIDLATLRMLSDRERMMKPGDARAAVRARIMPYVPALLDHLDELAAETGRARTPSDSANRG